MLSSLELFPGNDSVLYWLMWNYMGAGRYEEAAAEIEKLGDIDGIHDNPAVLASFAYAFSRTGRGAEANEILEHLLDLTGERYVPPSSVAMAYFSIGDNDRAIEYLDRALEAHDTQLWAWVASYPLDPLRPDRRFQDILRRMNFPEN
jgi:tetratricopeptide (TPR) repeat protein